MDSGKASLVLSQQFRWHDDTGSGWFLYGDDGYLRMDGSDSPIGCSRKLTRDITDSSGAMELVLRIVLGRTYTISFTDSSDRVLIQCFFDIDGCIKFRNADGFFNTGIHLTYWRGKPFDDPVIRPWHNVESDEYLLRFQRFDFAEGRFQLIVQRAAAAEPATLEVVNGFCRDGGNLHKVSFASREAKTGNMIRLKRFSEFSHDSLLDSEEFHTRWQPVSPPPAGMPEDNVLETSTRPVGYRWLETRTLYGYVKTRIPPICRGEIEFSLKTLDAKLESAIILEEYDGTIKGGNRIQLAIVRNRIQIAREGGFKDFDTPLEAKNDVIYHWRIAWDKKTQTQNIWINHDQQYYHGKTDIRLANRIQTGIDAVTLHPASESGFHQKHAPAIVTYWGDFQATSYDAECYGCCTKKE